MSNFDDFLENPTNTTKKRKYNKKLSPEETLSRTQEDLFKQVPPHNATAEDAVISGVLMRPDILNEILDTLRMDDFYIPANKFIFQAFTELYSKSVKPDIITVGDWLQSHKLLEESGGAERLALLSESVVSGANAPHYAKIVREKAILRSLIDSSAKIISSCFNEANDVALLLDEAEKTIFSISERNDSRSYVGSAELLDSVFNTITERYKNKGRTTGLATDYTDLDRMTGGLQPSDLIIIAARPSMGKTAFALNVAARAAIRNDATVAVFSLEMSKESLMERLLCSWGHVELSKVRKGVVENEDWERLSDAASALRTSKLFIDDSSMLTPLELRARCRRIQSEHGLHLVIVDYLQLMHSARNDSRELEISDISRNLKALAKELHIPVIALSQLNRKSEDRADKRPMLSDLRESGAIEQDADIIMFIHREDYYAAKKGSAEKTGLAEVIIGKHRNGPTGTVELTFVDKYTAFGNPEYKSYNIEDADNNQSPSENNMQAH